MTRVDGWFKDWAERHMQRHPREDWPFLDEAPEFWRGWMTTFILHGVTEDVADEASARLMADPPRFRGDHPKAVLEAARAIFRERADAGRGVDPTSREAAELASRDCDDCGGQGLAVRYRRLSAGTVDDRGRARDASIELYCRCPMGRFLERAHREKSPEIRRRTYDLAEHAWLWGDEYRVPPGVPAVPCEAPATLAARAAAAMTPPRRWRDGLGPLPPFVGSEASGKPGGPE